jgi:WD repeat-containing protein 24
VLIHYAFYRQPERRSAADKLYLKPKGLGDGRYIPASQDMGTVIKAGEVEDMEAFKKLAQGYIIEGYDRTTICVKNSRVNLSRVVF